MSRMGAWSGAFGSFAEEANGRTFRNAHWLASAALCALAVPGYAQDAAQDQAAPTEEDGGGFGEEIVVTAERRATNLQDTPLSVVAITSEIAEAKGIEDLEDLAKFTPNLSITPTRGGGNNTANFVIRGIGGGGGATGERGVGLYIDGIYMPRTSGAVLKVLDVDRIEVLRGPQGTLFGRNSTGGAIRIFSKQPTDEFEGYVRGTLGNMDRTDFVGMVNIPLGDTFAIRAQGAYLKQDGFVRRGTEKLGAERDIIGRLQARWEPSSRLRATLGFLYNDSESNGTPYVMTEFDMRPGIEGVIQGNYADWINDAFKLAGQAPLAAYNDPRIVTGDPFRASDLCFMDDFNPDYDPACNQFSNDVFWQADFNIAYDLTDNLTVTSITGYSELEHEGVSDFQVLGTESRGENVNSEVFYQELQFNAALFGGAVDLVTGGSYFREDSSAPNVNINRKGTSVFPSGTVPPGQTRSQQTSPFYSYAAYANGDRDGGLFRSADIITEQVADSFGVFASATLHVNEYLNLTGGVRHAWDKKDYTQTRFPGTPNISAAGGIVTPSIFTTTPEFTVAPGTTSTTVHSDASFKALDYRGTVDVHITDDIMAYATISKAYKAGSFAYTIVGWTAANQATGEAQSALIQPIPNEKVVNYEIGTRMELFDGRLRLNPTAFIMDYTNRQAATQVQCASIGIPASQCPVGFVIQVSNQGDVRMQGVEVDGQLSITRNLVLDGSFAFTDAELRNAPAGTVNLFPDIPSPTYNIGATWSVFPAFGEVTLNANYAYVGKQATHPSEGTDSSYTLPSYGLVNARVQVKLDALPVTITAFANNLFDNTYATYAQRFGGGFWDSAAPSRLSAPLRSALAEIRGRPREVGVTLQYDF